MTTPQSTQPFDLLRNAEAEADDAFVRACFLQDPCALTQECYTRRSQAEDLLQTVERRLEACLCAARASRDAWCKGIEKLSALLQPTGSFFRSRMDADTFAEISRTIYHLEDLQSAMQEALLMQMEIEALPAECCALAMRAKRLALAAKRAAEECEEREIYKTLVEQFEACEQAAKVHMEHIRCLKETWSRLCGETLPRFLQQLCTCADLAHDGEACDTSVLRSLCVEMLTVARGALS